MPRVLERRDERVEEDCRDRNRRDRTEAERRGHGDDHLDFHDVYERRHDHYDDDNDRWPRNQRGNGRCSDSHGTRHAEPRQERSRFLRWHGGGHSQGGRR